MYIELLQTSYYAILCCLQGNALAVLANIIVCFLPEDKIPGSLFRSEVVNATPNINDDT